MRAALIFLILTIFMTMSMSVVSPGGGWCSTWSAWDVCVQDGTNSCTGTRERERDCYVNVTTSYNNSTTSVPGIEEEKESEACLINVNGGFSAWSAWSACSVTCDVGSKSRSRSCNNPKPCNNGTNCVGTRSETVTCNMPTVDGEWSSWGNFSSCSVPMGVGVWTKYRTCNNPPVCGGKDCEGPSNYTEECRVVPPCFSAESLFDPAYQSPESPLQIYSTVKIEIGSNLQLLCSINVAYKWDLYALNETDPDTLGNGTLYTSYYRSMYQFYPSSTPLGLYRLDFNASYDHQRNQWVNGYMYVEIMYPPPNPKVSGGSGRMIGPGYLQLDALTESYDLVLGPGQNAGLSFSWACFRLFTTYLYDLLKISVLPQYFFPDSSYDMFAWHNNTILNTIYEISAWTNMDAFIDMIGRYDNVTNICFGNYTNDTLMYELYNNTGSNNITAVYWKYEDQVAHDNMKYVLYQFFDSDINFNSNLESFEQSITFNKFFFIPALEYLKGLASKPTWTNDLENHILELERINSSLSKVTKYYGLLTNVYHSYVSNYTYLDNHVAVTCYAMTPEKSVYRFTKTLNAITDFVNNTFNWADIFDDDRFFTREVQDVYLSDNCNNFTDLGGGFAQVHTSKEDMLNGTGYIVVVEVNANNSHSYFIQRLQVTDINPVDVSFEMNCMEKMASTSKMSLRALCPTCTYLELMDAQYKWNILEFDSITGDVSDIPSWENWLLSEQKDPMFVLQQNSLQQQSQYVIEVNITLPTSGRTGLSFILLTTDITPYGGVCTLKGSRDFSVDDSKIVECRRWKDEGFRSSVNALVDWKEPLNYRVLSRSGTDTKLLYFGVNRIIEGVQFVQGDLDNNNYAELILQIFDVFNDYSEVVIPIRVSPPYTQSGDVSDYLKESHDTVTQALASGDVKRVSMAIESGASVVTSVEFPQPLVSDNASAWASMGVYTDQNGNVAAYTWDDLWEDHTQNENETQTALSYTVGNYSATLHNSITNIEEKDTDINDIKQLAQTYGTTLSNADLVTTQTVVPSFISSDNLIDLLLNYTEGHPYTKFEDYEATSDAMVRLMDNALAVLLPTLSPDFPADTDVFSIEEDIKISELFLDSNQASVNTFTSLEKAYLASEKAKKKQLAIDSAVSEVRANVPLMLTSLDKLGQVLSEMVYQKQLPVLVQQPGLKTSMETVTMPELMKKVFSRDGVTLKLSPSAGEVDRSTNDIQITQFSKTPFSWDPESKFVTSDTVTVVVQNASRIPKAMPIKLSFKNSADGTRKSVQLAVTDDVDSQAFFMQFYWKNVLDNLIYSIKTNWNGYNHRVFLRKDVAPNEKQYDWSTTVEKNSWSGTEFLVVIPAGTFASPGMAFIAVQVMSDQKNSSSRKKRSTLLSNGTDILNYSVVAYTVGCRVWDDNSGTWDKSSCKVSSSTTSSETVCECDNPPGNSFATTFYVPPNMIDFSSVFTKFDLLANGAVFGTVVGVMCLYLLLCVWAYRQDKKDLDKWKLSYLADNMKSDKYLYLVRVYTGLTRNASTASRISFILAGEEKDTGIRHLEDKSDMRFGVGSVRTFVMGVPQSLGDLTFINIWHDNSGRGSDASWYLSKIIVEDVQTGKRHVFLCNQWLSIDDDDGHIQRILSSSDQQDLHSFSLRFNEQARYSVTDNHLWLSVILRPEESYFTRVQRLSCCLAFLFLAMISNAMFFQATDGTDQVNIGPLKFTLSGFYVSIISLVITTPPLLLVTFMFKRSTTKTSRETEYIHHPDYNTSEASIRLSKLENFKDNEKLLDKKQRLVLLPYWCRYVAWIILALSVLVPGFFVVLYSMDWGKSKSEEWLKCFFLSFFESLFIMDPIKVIVLAALFSFCLRNKKDDVGQYDSKHDLDIRQLLEQAYKYASAIPRINTEGQGTGDGYQSPLGEKRLHKIKSKRFREVQAQKIFFELLLYMMFLCVLYLISYSNRDTQSFLFKQHLDQQLLYGSNSNTANVSVDRFYKIKTGFDFYAWILHTLLPFLFPKTSYNGQLLNSNEKLYLADQSNFRVGPLRLRQLRARREWCMYPLIEDAECVDEYSIPHEQTTDQCVGWTSHPCTTTEKYNFTSADAWKFTPSIDIWGLPMNAESKVYGGGGYIADLGVNFETSTQIVNELLTYSWIDRQTRAVFVEFTIYNTNVNLFSYVSLPVEFPETGGVLLSDFIQPFRTYQHLGSLGIFTFICEIIYLLSIAIFAIKIFKQLFKQKRRFFQCSWQVFDLICIHITITGIGVYIARLIFTSITMGKFSQNKNKFVNFSHIATTDEVLNAIIGSLVYLCTLRLLRVLSYNKRLTQLSRVLTHAYKELIGCFIMFGIVYFAYAMTGFLIFGRHLRTYSDVLVATTTITNALIGRNSINDLRETQPIIAEIYYFTFILFVMWILMTMLNATLNKSITEVRLSSHNQDSPYGIYDMVCKFCKDIRYFIFGSTEEEMKYPYGKDVIYVQEKSSSNVKSKYKKENRTKK